MSFAAPRSSRFGLNSPAPEGYQVSPTKSPYGQGQYRYTAQPGWDAGEEEDRTTTPAAERVRQLEAENAELADHIFLSGPDRTDKMPGEVVGGFASLEDSGKKFWLRNEVIGFERKISLLIEERDEALDRAQEAQLVATEAVGQREAMAEEIQHREEALGQLMSDKVRLTGQVNELLGQQELLRQDKAALKSAKEELQKRLVKSDGALIASSEQVDVLTSMEKQLSARCNTLQSDLHELQDNPRIPLEFKQQVEEHTAEMEAEIARLEEDLARMQIENATLEAANANSKDDLALLRAQETSVECQLLESEAKAVMEADRAEEQRLEAESLREENSGLQSQLDQKPREITRTVYVPSPAPKAAPCSNPVSDRMVLDLFDQLDVDQTGYAPRISLVEEFNALAPREPALRDLALSLRALPEIVIERDDFKVLLAQWRGVLLDGAPPPQDEVPVSDSTLLKWFEGLDEEDTGFVPKHQLQQLLSRKAVSDPSLDRLVDLVQSIDKSIVDREDLMELLALRHEEPKQEEEEEVELEDEAVEEAVEAVEEAVGLKHELDLEGYMALFDRLDEDSSGFARRLDLCNAVEEHALSESVATWLKEFDGIIVDKLEFEDVVIERQ